MDLPEWNFSKESQSELDKFLAVVEKQTCNDNIQDIFDKFPDLIQNQSSSITEQKNISNSITTIEDNVEIIIIEDIDEIIEKQAISTQISDLSVCNLTLNVTEPVSNEDMNEFMKYIQETLETDATALEDSDIVKLVSFDDKNVIFLFKTLYKSLSDQGLFLFNHSIVSCTQIITNNVAKLFCKYILFNKLKETTPTTALKSVLKEFSETYPEITRTTLFIPIFLNDGQSCKWQEFVLNILEGNERTLFLRDFVYICNELEPWHISTLQSLISIQTEDHVKRRLIHLIDISNDKFTEEKLFIKFVITLIQCLGAGFEDLEQLLHNIIEKNQTLLKNLAQRALEDWATAYNNKTNTSFVQELH